MELQVDKIILHHVLIFYMFILIAMATNTNQMLDHQISEQALFVVLLSELIHPYTISKVLAYQIWMHTVYGRQCKVRPINDSNIIVVI